MRPQLTVVVPCYNEVDGIDDFYQSLAGVLDGIRDAEFRIVIVDDGSSDGTLDRLNELAKGEARLEVYSLSRNFGHQVALSAGLDVAAGDACILMDADLQHPPSLIPALLERWREGFDVVFTIRRETGDGGWMKRLTSWGFYWLMNRLSDTAIVPLASDFCLLSDRARRALCAMPERHRFLRGMRSWIGFRQSAVAFDAPARRAGESKYTTLKMLALARDALFSFSIAPMRLAIRAGAILLVCGLAYAVFVVVKLLSGGRLVPGWGSLIAATSILGGVQLLFVGLIGEYVARIFEETKRRPLYFFKQQPDRSGAGTDTRP